MNIAFIPARCGSESIPFKNIKIICGKPLIYWALLALTKSKNIDQIYVATDCDEIKILLEILILTQYKYLTGLAQMLVILPAQNQ